ncbi:MAG TPA: trypsin-like peptidase domain-containing protein [Terriglobales bacterium]|jgi:S1-C subfamily serine protease|nr:trypsin-like peptidase domain-containing protein [Terriglobales bacterium]
MRSIRPILLALLIAGVFYYFTTYHRLPPSSTSWVTRPSNVDITQAAGPQSFDPEEQENINVYKKALPAVVNITSTTVGFDFFYGLVPQQGQGSGFIIDKQGHILTNYHVIGDNPRRLEVTLSNRKKYPAEIVGLDKSHDLAVIQIKARDELTPAVLGDSHGLQVGQKVFAIGNPFGLNGTMTRGIVSSIRSVREPEGGALIDEAIQTDAPINPGNSGGPLLNSHGEVIGINTLILSSVGQSAGIGFAIPINAAKAVLNDLVQFGQVRRPVLGIRSLPIGPELAAQMGLPADYGLLVLSVVPGGPADRAGLRGGSEKAYLGNTPIMLGGDLIVRIDAQDIEDQQDIAHVMNQHHAGDKIKIYFFRGKRKMETTVTLGEARSYSGA